MKNPFFLGVLVFVSMIICGCRMNTTSIGAGYNDGLFLSGAMNPLDRIGTPIEKRHIEFNQIYIDSPCGKIINKMPDIYIGLPGGKNYYLPDLDIKTLEQIADKIDINDGRWGCDDWYKTYQIGTNPYCYDREYWLVVADKEGNICRVFSGPYRWDSKKEYRPSLWDSKLKKKYILPLTWQEAIELFGKPKSIHQGITL